jgi:hypothetical protein
VVFGTHTLAQILDALMSLCLSDGAVMMHMVHMVWCDAHVMMQCTTFSKLSKNVRYRKQPRKDSPKVSESQGLVQEASSSDFWERQLK